MALNFNGSSHRVNRSSSPVTGYPFWVCVWVRPDTTTSEGAAAGLFDSVDTSRMGVLQLSTVYKYIIAGASAFLEIGSASVSAGTWAHLIGLSRSATDHEFYVNGVSNATSSTDAGSITSFDVMGIGAENVAGAGWATFFDGDIGEVAWGDYSINDDEALGMFGTPPLLFGRQPSTYVTLDAPDDPTIDIMGGAIFDPVGPPPIADHVPIGLRFSQFGRDIKRHEAAFVGDGEAWRVRPDSALLVRDRSIVTVF